MTEDPRDPEEEEEVAEAGGKLSVSGEKLSVSSVIAGLLAIGMVLGAGTLAIVQHFTAHTAAQRDTKPPGWAAVDNNHWYYFAPKSDGKICAAVYADGGHAPYHANTFEPVDKAAEINGPLDVNTNNNRSGQESIIIPAGSTLTMNAYKHDELFLSLDTAKKAAEGWCPEK